MVSISMVSVFLFPSQTNSNSLYKCSQQFQIICYRIVFIPIFPHYKNNHAWVFVFYTFNFAETNCLSNLFIRSFLKSSHVLHNNSTQRLFLLYATCLMKNKNRQQMFEAENFIHIANYRNCVEARLCEMYLAKSKKVKENIEQN